jgi:hypothetical protein
MNLPPTAFYAMSSNVYFLGAVGMVNSLRLTGHDQPIYLLDLGLEPAQRELLAGEVTLVEPPAQGEPWLMKTIAPLAHPAEVMVQIDVDMVVTRHLGELIERARSGRVVAFENDLQRWRPEWGELLDLGELEPRPYLCSGFVAMGADPGIEVLETVADRQTRADFERSFFAANDPDYPLLYLDQDVLNAVLAARVERERVDSLPRLMAPRLFDPPQVLDAEGLLVRFDDGLEPWVVHHILPAKPWLKPMHEGAYSKLLQRCLIGPDLAIRVPEDMVPLRMRTGAIASLERRRVDAAVWLRWQVGTRVDRARARLGIAPRDPVPRL